MKITILYDNESRVDGLRADWGFSCLVEAHGKTILFDAGTNGSLLLQNMKVLGVTPASIDEVVISHAHFDHSGGLSAFLNENADVKVYAPSIMRGIAPAREVVYVDDASLELAENVFSTGLLSDLEQSLAVRLEKGLVVIVGCSHPGVGAILDAVAKHGQPYALVGGLHGFREFDLVDRLEFICPTHCTQHITEIASRYPEKYLQGGAGVVLEL